MGKYCRVASGLFEPGVNGRVVVRGGGESVGGEGATLLECGFCAAGFDDFEQWGVVCLGGNDHHVVEVLGGCADERDAADVDFLNNLRCGGAGGHGGFEWIEIYDDQIDVSDFVLCHLLHIVGQIAASEDAAEHFGVECLDASAQNGGIAREVFDALARKTERADEVVSAARRKELNALAMQGA